MLKKMTLISVFLLIQIASVQLLDGQAKKPTAPCEINVAELPILAGITFDMKIEEVKKQYKTIRVFTPPKDEILGQTKLYTLRPLGTDAVFKDELLNIDLAHSSKFGITSLALIFRPKTKLIPDEIFSKINHETGLMPSNWAYNDFGGQGNYRKWDAVCSDFSASFIAQTGYMIRLIIWRNPNSDTKKKPIDSRNIGD